MVIEKRDLMITREGFMKVFAQYRGKGRTKVDSFHLAAEYCDACGYQNRFTSYDSFKKSLKREGMWLDI